MDATRKFTNRLIEKNAHKYWGKDYSRGTNVLNYVTDMDVHEDELAKAAFNEVRKTPIYAAFLQSEMDGYMFDDGFGDWADGLGAVHLFMSAFGQVMASAVQVELDQRATLCKK